MFEKNEKAFIYNNYVIIIPKQKILNINQNVNVNMILAEEEERNCFLKI